MSERKSDISILVRQDNINKAVNIERADAGFEEIIGYSAQELKGMRLENILTDEISGDIINYLEFEEGGKDLGAVLSKVRDFRFLTKLGQQVSLNVKIKPALTDDGNPRFELVLRDQSEISKGSGQVLRSLSGRQTLDAITGLPDRQSFMREAEFVNFCVDKGRMAASCAVISIDGIDDINAKYGKDLTDGLIKELVARAKFNFREDDIMAMIDPYLLVVVLLEGTLEASNVPLNRLRVNQISFTPPDADEETKLTVSAAFTEIKKGISLEDVLENCTKALEKQQKKGGNKIIQVAA